MRPHTSRADRFGSGHSRSPAADISHSIEPISFETDIWLIGVHIAEGDRNEKHILWSDTPEEERANLIRLAEILAELPDLPVMSWAGSTADIPRLRGAVTRFKLDGLLDEMLTKPPRAYATAKPQRSETPRSSKIAARARRRAPRVPQAATFGAGSRPTSSTANTLAPAASAKSRSSTG